MVPIFSLYSTYFNYFNAIGNLVPKNVEPSMPTTPISRIKQDQLQSATKPRCLARSHRSPKWPSTRLA